MFKQSQIVKREGVIQLSLSLNKMEFIMVPSYKVIIVIKLEN